MWLLIFGITKMLITQKVISQAGYVRERLKYAIHETRIAQIDQASQANYGRALEPKRLVDQRAAIVFL
jgi:hypothetical protein